MASRYGINDTVKFAGRVENNIIEHYYHSAQAFVSASLTETQGMTYVEALASGLMVFARYDNVLDDLVIPEKTGYFFENADDFCTLYEDLSDYAPIYMSHIIYAALLKGMNFRPLKVKDYNDCGTYKDWRDNE